MPRRKDERPRVLGPYWIESTGYYRVTTVDPEQADPKNRRRDSYFREREEAEEYQRLKTEAMQRLYGLTFAAAIDAYREHMKEMGNMESSYEETPRRLRLFFPLELRIAKLTEERAAELYREFAARTYTVGPRNAPRQKAYSVAHHRHTLAQAKTFLRWCVAKKWIKASPLERVDGVGAGNVGKPQLTGDEAQAWFGTALAMAEDGDQGALGCLLALTLALRNGDVRLRAVRDVDLGGTVLRITNGKTPKSNRPRKVPTELRPLLLQLAAGRSPLEPLFKTPAGGFHTKSWLRCSAKRIAKKAGTPYVCPHGLKGTAASVAVEIGETAQNVTQYLSHTKQATGERHYMKPGALQDQQQEVALKVITGGKR
jgi:integrase